MKRRVGACAALLFVVSCSSDDSGGRAGDDADALADTADTPADAPPDSELADTAPDSAPEAVADTVPEVVPDTAPEAIADTAPEVVPDTAPEVVADTAPDDVAAEADGCATAICSERRPIILVHGINGSPADFDVMAARLLADGWPADYIVRFAAADPAWGCNVDNAAAIAQLVADVQAATCQGRVDIVAHSMGSLSSRYYIKNLGGTEEVNTYVTLGGMHHGLFSPCLAPDFLGVCTWRELCQTGEFIAQLNADPATPGELHWVSIYGTADTTVPNESSHLDGAENIIIEGAEHFGENGLEQRADVYAEVKRVLGYDCW